MFQAPQLSSVCPPACDGALSLLAAGQLCSGLSRASPGGAWSSWRKAWQLCWALALFSVGVLLAVGSPAASMARGPALLWAAACCGAAAALALTLPKGQSSPGRAAAAPMARLLFLADAGLALAVALSAALWVEKTLAGLLAAAMTSLPLALWAVGLGLCQTEAEMLKAMPSALVLWPGAAARALLLSPSAAGLLAALPLAALTLAHLALFLPLPSDDPESNLFYIAFKKWWKNFTTMMSSSDGGGFADE